MIFLSDDVFRLQKIFILLPVVLALEKQEKEEDDDDTKADLVVVVVVVVLVALTAAVVRSAANLCIVLSRTRKVTGREVCFFLFFVC
jgi:hypothetical protein